MRPPVVIRTAGPTVEETARLLGVPKSRVKFLRAPAERLTRQDFDDDSIAPSEPAEKYPKQTRSAKPSLANKPGGKRPDA